MIELTEERLEKIERDSNKYRVVGVTEAEVSALVAEVRRLRKILDGEHHKPGAFDRMTDRAEQYEDEREEARSLLKQAVSYLYCHMDERVRAWTLEMNRLFVKWAGEELEQIRRR